MTRKTTYFLLLLLAFGLHAPLSACGTILTKDTTWQGKVLLNDDLLVPAGVTLTIRPGTTISVKPADSARIEPEFLSPLTELAVRGTLVVEGTPAAPVLFRLAQDADDAGDPDAGTAWAGVIVDGGTARLHSCTIQQAEAGLQLLAGSIELRNTQLTNNHYGLVIQNANARVRITKSLISGNEYGLVALAGAGVPAKGVTVTGNTKQNIVTRRAAPAPSPPKEYRFAPKSVTRIIKNAVLRGQVVWQGRIQIDGLVRQPPDSRLIILPGTIVEFRKKDTNGDGIGENGLMLQGVLIAKGTPTQPILFRSAEKHPQKGDWDAINIINSDGAQNLIEYCQIEDAYRGLHFHFANAAIQESIFRHNYRAIQFQESAVTIKRNVFYDNNSAVQARDSEIVFTGNQVIGNLFGANFFRAQLTLSDNRFISNLGFGLKIRDGYPTISHNVFADNRFGLKLNQAQFGRIKDNLILGNAETGLALKADTNQEISNNFIQGNGLGGITVRDTNALIQQNQISKNGERGIGVISFYGTITRNNFIDNDGYAIDVENGAPVTAPSNWFGGADPQQAIHDQRDDRSLGLVHDDPVADNPYPYQWPLPTIPTDLVWDGSLSVPATVTVHRGIHLKIAPGTRIAFGPKAGLLIHGRLVAVGRPKARITFTSLAKRKPGAWGEIKLEHADGSRFVDCDFEYASWGIHCHFTCLPVIGCSFRKGIGGIRFRSGPLTIKNCRFSQNQIGIRAFRGTAEITDNIITRNGKGIFVREKGGGLTVHHNDIYANDDYNIWVGDFNTEDVQAQDNWWGGTDPAGTIYDARREPGIGYVRYKPILQKAVKVKIGDGQ